MVIYSTTRDKPVLGEIVKMGLCQMLTKGHCIKNSSSCVSVEYTSQANPANPHFFRFAPPLLTFLDFRCIIIFPRFLYWYLDGVMM